MEPRPPRTTPIQQGPARPYTRQFFVCTYGPECPGDGPAEEIRAALKKENKTRGLQDEVRVNRSGCLGQCGHGPMMVVYPEGVWYSHLDVDAALRVYDAHLTGNGPVDAHRFRIGPGGCKAARDEAGTTTCIGQCHQASDAD